MLYEVITFVDSNKKFDLRNIAEMLQSLCSYDIFYTSRISIFLTRKKVKSLNKTIQPNKSNVLRVLLLIAAFVIVLAIVITSYSIHYTKLYEIGPPRARADQSRGWRMDFLA